MPIHDTYKWGTRYINAEEELFDIYSSDNVTEEQKDVYKEFGYSLAEFALDPEYDHGWDYRERGKVLPMIYMDSFGGYPGEALDDANAQAAREWAEDREYIWVRDYLHAGCVVVELLFDPNVHPTVEDAWEAIELIEYYQHENPVLDEDLLIRFEMERWEELVDDLIVTEENERDIFFTPDQRMFVLESANDYFGHWEEGYFQDDIWEEIVAEALAEEPGSVLQLHQAVKLW